MDRISRWKLADELTAYQIALLIAGYDPSDFEGDMPHTWPKEVHQDISPFMNAIKNAARSGKLKFTPVKYENGYHNDDMDWGASTIEVDSLCDWLRLRNFPDGFFLGGGEESDKLVDPSGEFYAPKLAAAVRAWKEVTETPDALNGRTPKKALEVWLRKHANEYGLTNKDGNPNELGIEEISKIANWKPTGGASPTPVLNPDPSPPMRPAIWARKARPNSPTQRRNPPTPRNDSPSSGLDDDVPF